MPAAYSPPMMAPIEVPTTMSTGTRDCSSTLSTPTWASPRAPPPESTRATLGLADVAAALAVPACCARETDRQTPSSSNKTTR